MTSPRVSSGMVERVAIIVRQMTATQRARLLELAPELQYDAVVSDQVGVQVGDESVANYFERRMSEVLSDTSSDDSAPFLGEYTLDQFCHLPEDEQVRLWDQAHVLN